MAWYIVFFIIHLPTQKSSSLLTAWVLLRRVKLHPKLPPYLPRVFIPFKPKLDTRNILKSFREGGFLESAREICKCDSGEEGAGFGVLFPPEIYQKVSIALNNLRGREKGTDERRIRSPNSVVVTTEARRRGEVYTANGDIEFFRDFGPVRSCFGVGVCVVFFLTVLVKIQHGSKRWLAHRRRRSGLRIDYLLRL